MRVRSCVTLALAAVLTATPALAADNSDPVARPVPISAPGKTPPADRTFPHGGYVPTDWTIPLRPLGAFWHVTLAQARWRSVIAVDSLMAPFSDHGFDWSARCHRYARNNIHCALLVTGDRLAALVETRVRHDTLRMRHLRVLGSSAT